MSVEPKDIKSIFLEAIEKETAEERADYLDHVCGNDASFRAEFESLLKAHSGAGDFLESPAIEPDRFYIQLILFLLLLLHIIQD